MNAGTDRALWWLLAMASGIYCAVIGARVAISLAGLELGASAATIGLLSASFSLVPMLLAMAGGRVIDRVGSRPPMLAGAAMLVAGLLAPAVLWGLPALFVSALLIGLGLMSYHMAMQKVTGDIGGPERRARNFNLFALSFSVSGIGGPALAGLLIDTLGHRAAFAALALLPVIVLLACIRWHFERHLVQPEQPMRLPTATGDGALELLGQPRMRRLLIASVLVAACWDVFQFLIPLYGASIGLSASAIGSVLSMFALGSLLIRLVMPWLLPRVSSSRLVSFALLLSIVVYAALPFAPNLLLLIALATLLGVAPGIAQPLLLASLHAASSVGRAGATAGLRLTLISGMQLLVPVGLGSLIGMIGFAPLFLAYSLVASGVTAVLWRGRQNR